MNLYPPIEPYATQMVAVSPRHSLYVERSGKAGGYPIFFLHGGPGSQSRAAHRRYFDPAFYDIVLFDQRGCGKSAPAGDTQDNTTDALVQDIYTLRQALGIQRRISLFAGSWGSVLALCCAQRYPQMLDELILRGIFLATEAELHWYLYGLARFAPGAWQQFARDMGEDLLEGYYQAVFSADLLLASAAAERWVDYESQLMSIGAGFVCTPVSPAPVTPAAPAAADVLRRARVQLHYLRHGCFLHGKPLLAAARHLQLPVTIVQGALDLICPPITAWQLSASLPDARLRMIADAGHGAMSGSLALALKEEADALRDRRRDDSQPSAT